MSYSITKTQSSLMILTVAILIIEMLYTTTLNLFSPGTEPNIARLIVLNIIHVVAYGYLMFQLFSYFRYNHQKVLQASTLLIAVTEIAGIIITSMHQIYQVPLETMPAFNKSLLMANSFVWNTALFVWIIFLLLTNRQLYPPITYIQRYGVGVVVIFLMGAALPQFFKVEEFPQFWLVIGFASATNYLFLIGFTLKISNT